MKEKSSIGSSRQPVETIGSASHESRETDPVVKQARDRVMGMLNDQAILVPGESSVLRPASLDELMVRFGADLVGTEKSTQEQKKKIRRVLGLASEEGGPLPQPEKRQTEIRELTEGMRKYLEFFQKAQPAVVGMVLCGSRMDKGKSPDPESDVDVVLVLKKGTIADPRTPEGEKTLFALRGYTDNNPTEDGRQVEVDGLYAADKLVESMRSENEDPRMIWGWNPDAITYVGDDFEDMNEDDVKSFLALQLKSETADALRRQMIKKAAQMIISK